MATFYWVGGSGNWDATTTTNWASSSGGAGGAGVPTSNDDVVFDANSSGGGAFAVTVTGTDTAPAVCQDFTASSLSHVMTLTFGTNAYLDCYGNLTWPASNFGISLTGTAFTGFITFRATTTGKTITTNGVTSTNNFQFRIFGVGGGYSLGSSWNFSQSVFTVIAGSFDTANYSFSSNSIQSSYVAGTYDVRSISLGSSSVTLTGAAGPIQFTDPTDLTFNAGTSTITLSNANPTFNGGGQTFYNVTFSSTASGNCNINGDNTFNDLIFTTPGAFRNVNLGGNQIVNGTLTLGASNTNIRKVQVGSSVNGTQRTITANGTLSSLNDVSFRDITVAGTVSTPWTGTRIGSGGNINNITADAPKTVYRISTGNWNNAQWALSSGGATSLDNFPMPQDTIIFDNNTASTTHIINSNWWFGSLDCSAVTSAITIDTGNQAPNWHGDITLDSDITITATGNAWFFAKPSGSGAQVITPAGVTFAAGLTFTSPAGVQFAADITTDRGVNFIVGTLDLNDFDLTCLTFASTNTNTRSIDFGTSSEINVTGNNAVVFNTDTANNLTITGTPTLNFTYNGSTGTRIIDSNNAGITTEAVAFNFNIQGGTDIVRIYGRGFKSVNFTGFTGTIDNIGNLRLYNNLVMNSGMTVVSNGSIDFIGSSGTQQFTTDGVTIDRPVLIDTSGATVQLQDALTMGSTRTLTLTAGTLDSNDFDVTASAFSSNNTNTRALDLGSSDWTLSGSGTVWNATDGTGLTVTPGTSSITLTSASAYTFAGGGKTYYDLNLDGDADVSILGSNTFNQLSVAEDDLTITFEAGSNTTVAGFSADGTSGNLILMRSSSPGTVWEMTDTSGSVSVSYSDIQDMNAKGGATFECDNGINSGNNTGMRFVNSKFETDNFFSVF